MAFCAFNASEAALMLVYLFRNDHGKLSPKEAGLERIRDLDVLSTIPEMLALQVEKRPDAVGWKSWDPVKKSWRDWTFRQGYDEVQRWRHAFAGLGLTRGTRVAMLLPNCIEAVLFDQAALANALTPVPLHAIDTPKSSAYILNDSGAEVLVTNKKLKWRLVREAAELPNLKLVVITDDDFADDPDADIPMLSLETWLAKTPDAPLPPGPRSTDLAALVYTSGTTGNPKGVMLTHRNVLSISGVCFRVCSPMPMKRFCRFSRFHTHSSAQLHTISQWVPA